MKRFISELLVICGLVTIASAQGVITTVAGTDSVFIADGVPALQARLSGSLGLGVATDVSGNLYVADPLNRAIFKVSPSGVLKQSQAMGSPPFRVMEARLARLP